MTNNDGIHDGIHGGSSIVDIKELEGDGKLTIVHSYGNNGFRIAKEGYEGKSWRAENSSDFHLPRGRQRIMEPLNLLKCSQ